MSLMGFLSNETDEVLREVLRGILGARTACHRVNPRLIRTMTPLLSGKATECLSPVRLKLHQEHTPRRFV
ncbi:hypothetical protein GCM10010371_17250 [Streptomyces subrutilus]|uniref:Uncharacterized protein n=1 Tax=Streptomyces subrutilus TaxID=36818 RepID=A0A918V2E9_9ACTN|nr:hypothetical protein GCM10010371_17250 [Streptomyces subrutilus]